MTTSNKQRDSSRLSAAPLPPEHDMENEEEQLRSETDEDAAQPPSEVAMRLNLLGKLIIPPSAP